MKIITRKKAMAQRLKQYFTGIPCKNKHTAPRFVKDWKCTECVRIRNGQQRKKFYTARRKQEKLYFKKHREEYRIRSKQRYYKNHEHTLQKYKNSYAANPQKHKDRAKTRYDSKRSQILQQFKEYYLKTKNQKHREFIEKAQTLYIQGIDKNKKFNEKMFKHFIAGYLIKEYGLEVFSEVKQGTSRADLFIPRFKLIIECKVESTKWTFAQCAQQKEKYVTNFGKDHSVMFLSPEGRYGISMCDLPTYFENLLKTEQVSQVL